MWISVEGFMWLQTEVFLVNIHLQLELIHIFFHHEG